MHCCAEIRSVPHFFDICQEAVTDLAKKVHGARQILVVRSAVPPGGGSHLQHFQASHRHHGYHCLTPLAMANRTATVEHLRRQWQTQCAPSHNKDLRARGSSHGEPVRRGGGETSWANTTEGEKGNSTGRVSISSWHIVEC